MTSDHFRQFLVNPTSRSFAGPAPMPPKALGQMDKANMKVHVMWALALSGAAYASWKVSKWHSTYEKSQAKKTLAVRKKKRHS